MNPHAWMGADAVFSQQGADTVSQLPSIPELLTSIHALDAEIRQTDYEIAAQTAQAPLREAAFVDEYWRPFVSYWGHAMQEVYEYERRALGDRSASHSPNLATAAMSLWGVRSKYYDLRREALNWGFSLHPSPSGPQVGLVKETISGGSSFWSDLHKKFRSTARQIAISNYGKSSFSVMLVAIPSSPDRVSNAVVVKMGDLQELMSLLVAIRDAGASHSPFNYVGLFDFSTSRPRVLLDMLNVGDSWQVGEIEDR